MVNRVKIAEIYLDLNTSYGTLEMAPAYRSLSTTNWIDVADALTGISEGAAAMYVAAVTGDGKRYSRAAKALAHPAWSETDRALIDDLLGRDGLPPSVHDVGV